MSDGRVPWLFPAAFCVSGALCIGLRRRMNIIFKDITHQASCPPLPNTQAVIAKKSSRRKSKSRKRKPRTVEKLVCKQVGGSSAANQLPAKPASQFVSILPGKPLLGQDKWLGGVASPCGKYIYGVPGNAQDILRIDVATGRVLRTKLPAPRAGKFKWLRGVDVPANTCTLGGKYPSGIVICCPSNANSVLRIDPSTQAVTQIGAPLKGTWKWHGGNLAADGYIYCIPCNADRVLKINPGTSEVTKIGPVFKGKQKWYGGILASNGAIYGIPHCATGVLKIDPKSQTCRIFGEGLCGVAGGWKWHGGLATPDGRYIYGFPNNADHVLKIDTYTDTVSQIGRPGVLRSGRHRVPQDGKYKYLGGAISDVDGNLYCFPCDAERVLRVDTRTDDVRAVGPELLEGVNKWQNGFAGSDGCVYAIPQRSSGILRVRPSTTPGEEAEVTVLECGPAFSGCKDKFEGGVLGQDGCIYCIPLRAKHALKVVPGVAGSASCDCK